MTAVDIPPPEWTPLGAVAPNALTETRLELHWAAQLVGAVPLGFLKQVSDFSHANLGWMSDGGLFVTRPVGAEQPVQVALRVDDFSLVVLDRKHCPLDELPLVGRTLDHGYAWIAEQMDRDGVGKKDATDLHRPDDSFPDHPVRAGAAFSGGSAAARTELVHWYDNTLLLLSKVVRDNETASPVRTWPHHFDMATLITLEAADDPERMRSVGIGMTPGDSSYGEPYFYAVPWPIPDNPELAGLEGGGTWHTDGWVGAVLTGSDLIEGDTDGPTQAERARTFLASAVPAVRKLAGG